MLKPKVVKLIMDEIGVKPLEPFFIEGYSTPYRFKKDGTMERYIGKTWGDTSFCYTDLIVLVDAKKISLPEKEEKEALKNELL